MCETLKHDRIREEADRMVTKLDAEEELEENKVTHTELKTIIKSLYRSSHPQHNKRPSTVKARTIGHIPSEDLAQPAESAHVIAIPPRVVQCLCKEAVQTHTTYPPGLQKPSDTERRDLADARPDTRKAFWARGCSAGDHRFHLESCLLLV